MNGLLSRINKYINTSAIYCICLKLLNTKKLTGLCNSKYINLQESIRIILEICNDPFK